LKITNEHLIRIRNHPHLLGLLVGKKDLTELHSDWIKYIWTENLHRSLQAHRGAYKTTAVTIVGCIYGLLFHPDYRIGIIRENFTDASECLKNVSTLMKREEIKEIFYFAHGFYPKAIIDRADSVVFNFKKTITPEGNINAYGITQSITGTHLDFVLCDDFVTIKDKTSKAKRDTTKIMLEEIVNNVLDPGMGAGFVGTPWYKDDAWKLCPEPKRYDVYSTGILSEEEILKKKSRTTNVTFASNYELRHAVSANAIFQNPSYAAWDYRIKTGIGHIDAAYTGTDTNAMGFIAKKNDGRYQGIGWIHPGNIKDWWSFIKEKWQQYYIGTIYCENNSDKGFVADALWEKEKIPAENYHEAMNKHVKIRTHILENGFWELIDWDPKTDPEYLNQILDYIEGAEPDDAPDDLACLGRILLGEDGDALWDM